MIHEILLQKLCHELETSPALMRARGWKGGLRDKRHMIHKYLSEQAGLKDKELGELMNRNWLTVHVSRLKFNERIADDTDLLSRYAELVDQMNTFNEEKRYEVSNSGELETYTYWTKNPMTGKHILIASNGFLWEVDDEQLLRYYQSEEAALEAMAEKLQGWLEAILRKLEAAKENPRWTTPQSA